MSFRTCRGTQTWCGLGVLAHNAVKIGRLIEEKEERDANDWRHVQTAIVGASKANG